MSNPLNESNFEASIEADLLRAGYRRRLPADYDASRGLDAELFLEFIRATQLEKLQKLGKVVDKPEEFLLTRLQGDLNKKGAVPVLRQGLKIHNETFHTTYFPPNSSLNDDAATLYRANSFSVMRQLITEKRGSAGNPLEILDLTLFLNGIPLFTAELKAATTGQTVRHAQHQYCHDRDPSGILFRPGRCIAHFAVDTDWVFVTTALAGKKTRFLPYNRGYQYGAANPPNPQGYKTAYLWLDLWAPDSVLELIKHFLHLSKEKSTDKGVWIFPRYHQRQAVHSLLEDARDNGPGKRYLVQHSAGSGKSFTIAWLAQRLTTLFRPDNERLFHTVVVLTDRKVLDQQLQRTLGGMSAYRGKVKNITDNAAQLREAIRERADIVVTTQQKFSVIDEEARTSPDTRVALIIDEAHSSQDGETAKSVRKVMGTLEWAELLESGADSGDVFATEEAAARQLPSNTSVFAFTATPTKRTLQLFGVKQPASDDDGNPRFEPYCLYSMRQAIEEGFILDVLQNYLSYRSYFEFIKTVEEDPRYNERKVSAHLVSWVELQPHAVETKVAVMVDHFLQFSAHHMEGKAKAMIVTRSRLHAVRYLLALRAELHKRGCSYQALIAFSEKTRDPDTGKEYTESGLNGFSDSKTVETFKGDNYRFMVVANKLQTGFDQPLLHTMYVDKKLDGVNAIQTLSRLNRTHPRKSSTFVLDFCNDTDVIRGLFQDRYQKTVLNRGIEPQRIYDLQYDVMSLDLFSAEEVAEFARLLAAQKHGAKADARLTAKLDVVVERFSPLEPAGQAAAKSIMGDYVTTYSFVAQIISFPEVDLEKLYQFVRFLVPKLPKRKDELPLDVTNLVDVDSYTSYKTGEQRLEMEQRDGLLEQALADTVPGTTAPEELDKELSEILTKLNSTYGIVLAPANLELVRELRDHLMTDAATDKSLAVNPNPKDAEPVAMEAFNKKRVEMADREMDFYMALKGEAGEAAARMIFERKIRDRAEWLAQIAGGENEQVEFKSTWNYDLVNQLSKCKKVQHSSIKTIAAFLNSRNGVLYIGVEDDGTLLGLEVGAEDGTVNTDKFSLAITEAVNQRLGVSAANAISSRFQELNGKLICQVYCKKRTEPSFMNWAEFNKNGQPDLYVRTGASTRVVPESELDDFLREHYYDYWLLKCQGKKVEQAPTPKPIPKKQPAAVSVANPPEGERWTRFLPLMEMKAAAGAFSDVQEVAEAAESWVDVGKRAKAGMFVMRVEGHSMEPTIQDGSLCLFAAVKGGSKTGKIVLAQLLEDKDPENGGRYTVKTYESEKTQDAEGNPRITRILLKPKNPAFEALVFEAETEGLRILAEYCGPV